MLSIFGSVLEFLAVFLGLASYTTANHEVHLVPAHTICPNVTTDHDILLPDPHDCSVYYRCENGSAVPQSCPPGLAWCQIMSECTLPILANCTISHTVVTYSPDELATYNSSDTASTDVPTEPSQSSPTGSSTLIPSPTYDICPIQGVRVPDPSDCVSYYECENDIPKLHTCSSGLEYSSWDQLCIKPGLSKCITNVQENKPCTRNGSKLGNPEDCNSYFECVNGKTERKSCDVNLEYNQWFQTCVSLPLSHCKANTITTPTENKISTPSPVSTEPNLTNPTGSTQSETHSNEGSTESDQTSPTGSTQTDITSSEAFTEPNRTNPTGSTQSETHSNEGSTESDQASPTGSTQSDTNSSDIPTEPSQSSSTGSTQSDTSSSEVPIEPSQSSPTDTNSRDPNSTNNVCPNDDVVLPNPANCNQFYKCVNGTPTAQECNGTQKFSCWIGQCVDSNTAVCIGSATIEGEKCSVNGEALVYPQDCGKYYQCENNNAVLKSCPTGEQFNMWFKACYKPDLAHCINYPVIKTTTVTEGTLATLSPVIDICSRNGVLLPNLMDCKSYYVCQNNTPILEECPPGLYYSCWDSKCLPQSLASCFDQDVNHTSSCIDGNRLPNPANCHTFYQCINGNTELQYCNANLEYNAWNRTCVDPSLSHCKSNITITTTTISTTIFPSTTPSPSDYQNICPLKGATLPNPLNCYSYYICEHETPTLQSCPKGYFYSCWDKQCLSAIAANCLNKNKQEGQACVNIDDKLPNPQNCSTYYQCIKRKVQLMHCKSGYAFNAWFQKCVKLTMAWCHTYPHLSGTTIVPTEPTSITLPTEITPSPVSNICPINGAMLPNELNCEFYYKCENKIPVLKQCPMDEIYDCWNQKCTGKDMATCIKQGTQEGHSCSKENVLLPNINYCNSYSKCVNGKIQIEFCAQGTFFNRWFGICVDITKAYCPSTALDTTSGSVTDTSTFTPVTDYDLCPIDGALLPNPIDCSTYYKCINNIPILKQCPNGYEYSCWDQKCLPVYEADCIEKGSQQDKNCSINGQGLQNVEDCSSYYECQNGTVVKRLCLLDTKYNKWFGKCVRFELSHCDIYPTQPPQTTPSQQYTTLTPSPTNDICPINGAVLPNPSNCSSYYICEDGLPKIHFCAAGLVYSCLDKKCLPPSEGNCIAVGSQTGKNCIINEEKLQNPENCNSYYQCINGKIETKYCAYNWFYNKWFQICLPTRLLSHCETYPTEPTSTTTTTVAPSLTKDICPIEGAIIPDPLDCQAYYICKDSTAVHQKCLDGEQYSCWDQTCKTASKVECITSGNQISKKCSKDGERIANSESCSSYYECINGIVQKQYCFIGFEYNKWYGSCTLFWLSHCKTYTTSITSSTSTPGGTTLGLSTDNDVCPIEGALLPNAVDCSTYYQCINYTPVLKRCPDGQEYSCWDQTCEADTGMNCITQGSQLGKKCSRDGEYLPNVEDCSSYYECQNGTVVKRLCLLDTKYNKWFGKCVRFELSHCNTYPTQLPQTTSSGPQTTITPSPNQDICPIENVLLPNPLNCSTYYKCQNGMPVLHQCAYGLQYSCWDEECLPQSEANCIAAGSQTGKNCSKNGLITQNPENCQTYCQCENGIVKIKKCPFDWYYNKWFKICFPSKLLAHCSNAYPTQTTSTTTTTPKPNVNTDICPIEGVLLPDPMNCNGYFKCVNQSAVLQYCASGEEYSCWDQMCKPATGTECITSGQQLGKNCIKEGERLPDPESCSSFYQCLGGKVEKQYCIIGFKYNKWYATCTLSIFAHCNTYTTTSSLASTIPKVSTSSQSPTTVTPSPYKDICPNDGYLLPNPVNCSTYYKCVNQTPILQLCANGLHFSCWDDECLPPQQANCIAAGSQTGKNCPKNGKRTQNLENCQSYYECVNNEVETIVCLNNWYYNKWFGICIPSLLAHCRTYTFQPTSSGATTQAPQIFNDICPIPGALLPDPLDSTAYYKCDNNVAVLQRCPAGQGYSCWDQTCLPAIDAQYIAAGTQEGLNCSRNGHRLPNIESCDSYFQCTHGKVKMENCFIGFKYNKWYEICTLPLYAHCKTSPTVAPSHTTATTTYKPPTSVVCPSNGAKVPNPNNCRQYFVCDQGSPVLYNCPPGTSYDCWDQACSLTAMARCVSSETAYVGESCTTNGRKIPNIKNCNKYFECVNGKIEEQKCGILTQFSVWGNECKLIVIAQCANNKFLGII